MVRYFHRNGQSHWDDNISRDGGWLPHWDEALDELHWLCFSHSGGLAAPQIEKNKANVIHPKPHPNGATNLHPLGCYHPKAKAIGMIAFQCV